MFLHATWSTSSADSNESRRIETSYGWASLDFKVAGGRADLTLLFRLEQPSRYLDARRYGAFGLLLSMCERLPRLDGWGTTLSLTPASSVWSNGGVQGIIQRAGFSCSVQKKTLVLRFEGAPKAAIEKAAVVCFAIDRFSGSIAKPDLTQQAMNLLGRHQMILWEILELLGERGGGFLRKLLRGQTSEKITPQEEAIIKALARVKTSSLVVFHNEKRLKTANKLLALETAISVEPMLEKARRPQSRGFMRLHGSVVEPPEGLPQTATALLIEALPPIGDSRRSIAARVLFETVGFDCVLCVERSKSMFRWAEEVSAEYGYRCATWQIGTDYAAMFRRVPESRARGRVASHTEYPSRIQPRLGPAANIQATQWAQTLDRVSRLCVDPKRLIYIPPRPNTMQSTELDGELEPVGKVFEYYRNEGMQMLVMEARPLATRGVVVVCKDERSKRFEGSLGVLYKRTGEPLKKTGSVLTALSEGLSRAGFWERFKTDWVCFECDVLPWGRDQEVLERAHSLLLETGEAVYEAAHRTMLERFNGTNANVAQGQEAFRRYRVLYETCVADSKEAMSIAPVHLIAVEGRTFFSKAHLWHREILGELARKAGAPFVEMPFLVVRPADAASCRDAAQWASAVSVAGAQGVTIKPMTFLPKGRRGFAQPSLVCRGREHLRLFFGPEYDLLESRLALRDRMSNQREKNRIAIRQMALAVEGAERFVRGEAHEECVRGVLALEARNYSLERESMASS